MSKLIKDLGAVSAYAYAVEKGYTGTEDEFAELMYDYTDVAQTAVEAKDEAVSASASAQASATIANTKAAEASASASNAQSASNSAQGAETNAENFALNAGTKATEAKQFADKAELNAQKTQSDKEAVESAKSDVLSAVDNAQNYANFAQSASQAIQNMGVEATTLEPDSDATVEKTVDSTSGAVTLTYGIPKGQVGEKGDKGDTGDSGVYIGTSAPSDENVNVWIDSDGEPDNVIQIDDTLTQSGQAADAKKTGNEIISLKEELNGDIDDLKSDLGSLGTPMAKSANEFGNEWTTGGYINPSTGEIEPASTYKYSDFYLIKSGTHRTLYVRTSTSISQSTLIRYDANKNIIGSRSISANTDYPIEDNVAYIRASVYNFNGDLFVSTEQPTNGIDYSYDDGYILKSNSMPLDYLKEIATSDNKFSNYWTTGGYINVSTNNIESASTWKYTPKYIELPTGKNRKLYLERTTSDGSITVIRYDAEYNILGTKSLSGGNIFDSYEIADNVAYLRCYVQTTFTGNLYVSTKAPSQPVDYSYATETVIKASKVEQIDEEETAENASLTVVNFGDSIYGNFQDTSGSLISVSALIAKQTGYNVINGAFGGCQMHQHHVAGWTPFSMYKIADAIVSGDWSEQDASWADRTSLNLPYYFGNTIAVLKALDFSKVDIITIEYGTNDWSSGDTLVSPTQDPFDTNTFGGALRYTIKKFLEAYPNLKIVVQNPTPRFTIENNVIIETSDTRTNTSGDTLVDFIEEENKVCKEYKIPVVDAYYPSMFNIYTNDVYFNNVDDGVHLGLEGRKRLANIMSKYLMYQL